MSTHSPDSTPHRHIRSFVLRQGRITDAQERAFDEHWTRFGLSCLGSARDFDACFGRRAPRVLELGFGDGEQLHAAALADPDRDYLGIEVHRPGVGRLLNAVATDGLGNVRVYNHDAVEVLTREVGADALDEIRIYFPDPWPKKRHQKRRLIQPEFTALLASKLRLGGRLHLATDWADYAEHMLAVVDACPALRNIAGVGAYVPRPEWRIASRFERRGLRLGHSVWDLIHERI
jgi:tRNA (guanine-N7-)-methyltransferase